MDTFDMGSKPEEAFLTLLSHRKLSKAGFSWGAEQALGSEWKQLGKQIVEENAPDLMPRFVEYTKD